MTKKIVIVILLILLTHCAARAQWVRLSSQLTGPIVTVGNVLVLLGEDGIYRSVDSGITWKPSDSGVPSSVCEWHYLLANKGDVYLTTDYCGFFHSSDSGKTWVNQATNGIGYTFMYQPTIVGDTIYMGVLNLGIWESGDKGNTWQPMYYRHTNYGLVGDTEPLIIYQDSSYLFAGSSSVGGLFRSPDTAVTWDRMLPLSDTGIVAITANGRFVVAGYWQTPGVKYFGLYRSTDWGNTWQLLSNDGLKYGRIAVLSTINSIMFAGGDFGVYISNNNGKTWSDANGDTTLGTIYSFTVLGPYLYASGGGSTWRRPLSDFNNLAVKNEIPSSDTVSLNSYPNPFSQSIQISFTSQSAGYADVSVVNLLGAPVARVFSGELGAGQHSFTFSNTASLPDGMYECLIRMNARVEKLPMMKLSEP